MTLQKITQWLKKQEKHNWHIVSLELFSDGTWQTFEIDDINKTGKVIDEGETLEELEELISRITLEIQNVKIK